MEVLWGGVRGATALLAGAWNPPTRAHVEMARAALRVCDCAVLVLPRRFPHKGSDGAALELRAEWLRRIAEREERMAAAISEGGLFIEMAREARALGARRVMLACGADAAERIANWDYGDTGCFADQLEEYEMLVAPRAGVYVPAAEVAGKFQALELDGAWAEVSSTEVRRRMAAGEGWEDLVPEVILESVREAYS
jgi:nicotinic acid mononucleotide adenylyltransferase